MCVQIFVVFYRIDPVPSQGTAGLIFWRVAAYFVYGCLTPLTVSTVTYFISCHGPPGRCPGYRFRVVLTTIHKAIYPTIIIVLVALRRSPIDAGGLSQIYLAHDGAGPDPHQYFPDSINAS